MNVLIVDDSKAMQNIITKAMKGIGYQNDDYHYAADGEEALVRIREKQPDLVLCDLYMPRKSGLELLRALRGSGDATKVIIVSIDDSQNMASKVLAEGGNAFLKKPFTGLQLFDTVAGVVGKAAPRRVVAAKDIRQLVPPQPVLERILGSLAGSDVHLREEPFDAYNASDSRAPFYGVTLENDQKKLVMAVFLDVVAANVIGAIIGGKPLAAAVEAARANRLEAVMRQSALAFFGIYSALCKPGESGQLLNIHAEQYVKEPKAHLAKHLEAQREASLVYSLTCGPSSDGKMIIIVSDI